MPTSDRWEYGGVYRDFDMRGRIDLPGGSVVQVADWTACMPDFMLEADTLFIDPPWNQGNARSFYTKAGLEFGKFGYLEFAKRLLHRIAEIAPRHVFLEMGKEWLPWYAMQFESRYKHVTFYNSTYYRERQNKCYVIHATDEVKRRRYRPLEDMDEADAIRWVCENHDYQCIGDLCMGKGLVGRHAFLAGKRFVGIELNPKRLAHLVKFVCEHKARRQC